MDGWGIKNCTEASPLVDEEEHEVRARVRRTYWTRIPNCNIDPWCRVHWPCFTNLQVLPLVGGTCCFCVVLLKWTWGYWNVCNTTSHILFFLFLCFCVFPFAVNERFTQLLNLPMPLATACHRCWIVCWMLLQVLAPVRIAMYVFFFFTQYCCCGDFVDWKCWHFFFLFFSPYF